MKETPWTHTIRTRSHAMLLQAATVALETARLTIVRGPAGIGKTYALDLIEDELSRDGIQVYRVLASADKSASVKKFFEKAIFDLGLMGHGGSDPVDRLAGYLLRSYPFRKNGPRVLLVIDECQHLTAKLLETLRSTYDRGQRARDFDPEAPAFGMLFVGNPHFLTRGGKAERAAFEVHRAAGALQPVAGVWRALRTHGRARGRRPVQHVTHPTECGASGRRVPAEGGKMTLQTCAVKMTAEEATTFADAIDTVCIRMNQAENVFALLARIQQDGDYEGHFGLADVAHLAAAALGALGNAELDTLNKLSNRLMAG